MAVFAAFLDESGLGGQRGAIMTLLKSYREWWNWAKAESALGKPRDLEKPQSYPCYAYCTVLSFGYEEERPNYLYERDVINMLVGMGYGLK